MSTAVGIMWTLLSIVVAGACSFSFLQPAWFVHPRTLNALGMYGYCVHTPLLRTGRTHMHIERCGIYGGKFHFSNLPSGWWQAACVLYGGGCALMCVGALMAIMTLCLPRACMCDKPLAIFTGYLQTTAVLLMMIGLCVFPVGLDCSFVRHYCRGARVYSAGACHVGWGYMLGIMGTALSVFAPFLSHFTDVKLASSQQML